MLFDPATLSQPPLPMVNYDLPPHRDLWNGVFLVGEAPGREEVKLGRPFVGRSGKLLDEVLGEAKIDRKRCLVANVFRFQPPNNKIDHFFSSKKAAKEQNIPLDQRLGQFGSLWCKKEFSLEIDNLKETLEVWSPKVVIALGRTPLWALTGENGLLSKVGSLLDCRLRPKSRVLPTFHPSFILRGNWSKRPEWIEHFNIALHYVAQR